MIFNGYTSCSFTFGDMMLGSPYLFSGGLEECHVRAEPLIAKISGIIPNGLTTGGLHGLTHAQFTLKPAAAVGGVWAPRSGTWVREEEGPKGEGGEWGATIGALGQPQAAAAADTWGGAPTGGLI